jgi:hypothetical protein
MASSLSEQLLAPERRFEWIDCIEEVITDEVAGKRGLQGTSLRVAYRTLRAGRPDVVRRVLNRCWPEWVRVFASRCDDVPAGGLEAAFALHQDDLAEGMLVVVDHYAAKTNTPVVERLYRSLRGHAREHVVFALPKVARAIEQRRGE